jgi:ATP-dependent RNA circularization protein (DNA/RNA ligase family)
MLIKKIEKLLEAYVQYDITVQKNSNFIASGIVVHNSFGRYVYTDGKMYAGSRSLWKKYNENCTWWKALPQPVWTFCNDNPGWSVYGEVYGKVQDMTYGVKGVKFAAFDIRNPSGEYVDSDMFLAITEQYSIETVPIVHKEIPFDIQYLEELAEKDTLVAGAKGLREGLVIKPVVEKYDENIGRKILKLVSNRYLMS